MLAPDPSRQALTRLFQRQSVADLATLSATLKTPSRMSVFRRLSALGYLSSYSHAGRYYTLRDIPQFDPDGLWQYQGVCFSRDGSLKATVTRLVEDSEAGRTHPELHARLEVRVHNTLLDLVRGQHIGRESVSGRYLYVSANPARAQSQLSLRQRQPAGLGQPLPEPPPAVVIEVLLDLVQSASPRLDAEPVAERLAARGLPLTVEQVEAIFSRYGLKKNGAVSLPTLALLKRQIGTLQNGYQSHLTALAGMLVKVEQEKQACPLCQGPMQVQKTLQRRAVTLAHGPFRVREVVYVCAGRCEREGALVTRRAPALTELIPPRSRVGYDLMVYVGLQRYVGHRQREEIRATLQQEHGIHLSSGEISELGQRFVVYLETLHRQAAPALHAALTADGGWPLHIDATGEDGRGTLLVALAGWRRWVLGAWKIPTERAEAIRPRLEDVVARFGPPCAIMRDLGRAVTEAANGLVKNLGRSIPVLACHLHFLSDVGTDLLGEAHDQLRHLFRQMDVRQNLRCFARDQGRRLGTALGQAREDFRIWQSEPLAPAAPRLPEGPAGMVAVRALAQWALDYAADGNGQDFPFALPYLDLYLRCRHVAWAADAFLRHPPADRKVLQALQRLDRILSPIRYDVPPLGQVAKTLHERGKLFTELRDALRLTEDKPSGRESNAADRGALGALEALRDIRRAVDDLADSLRQRRAERGPPNLRQAIDLVLTHLQRHGHFLWGHAIPMPDQPGGGIRLVDRTNNILEGFFHTMKHGERRRSGRKNLAQDFERLPPGAALAANLTRPDYVTIVCGGSLDQLPQAFARLDAQDRRRSLAALSAKGKPGCEVESASLNTVDRRLVRTEQLERRILAAAGCRV